MCISKPPGSIRVSVALEAREAEVVGEGFVWRKQMWSIQQGYEDMPKPSHGVEQGLTDLSE